MAARSIYLCSSDASIRHYSLRIQEIVSKPRLTLSRSACRMCREERRAAHQADRFLYPSRGRACVALAGLGLAIHPVFGRAILRVAAVGRAPGSEAAPPGGDYRAALLAAAPSADPA